MRREKGRGIGWGEERGTEEKEVGGCERKENGKGKGCLSGGNETAANLSNCNVLRTPMTTTDGQQHCDLELRLSDLKAGP